MQLWPVKSVTTSYVFAHIAYGCFCYSTLQFQESSSSSSSSSSLSCKHTPAAILKGTEIQSVKVQKHDIATSTN